MPNEEKSKADLAERDLGIAVQMAAEAGAHVVNVAVKGQRSVWFVGDEAIKRLREAVEAHHKASDAYLLAVNEENTNKRELEAFIASMPED